MNYRECRLTSLYEIMKYNQPDLTLKKAFLALGGMRNALYLFKCHGVEIYSLCGCNEVNVPGIFEILNIDFTVIKHDEFFEAYEREQVDNKYLYVIPVVRDMLNVEDVDLNNYSLIGQSFFVVDVIEEDKIYFKTDIGEERYYLAKNVYDKVSEKANWVIESDYEVYRIDKEKVKENISLSKLLVTSESELLIQNIKAFTKNDIMYGDQGTVRYEGEQVYDMIINHLSKMKEYLIAEKDSEKYHKFIKYVYLQLINFRKMLVAGTDGYYRTEFCDVLKGYPKLASEIEKWDQIIYLWRNLGRKMKQVGSLQYLDKKAEEGLDILIKDFTFIKQEELRCISGLKQLIEGIR